MIITNKIKSFFISYRIFTVQSYEEMSKGLVDFLRIERYKLQKMTV